MDETSVFQGFAPDGAAFLRNLKRNNNREWFQANRRIFKTALEEPAKAFRDEMSGKLAALSGRPVDGRIFRIYRDVRFSKDKTPYNTHLRLAFGCQRGSTETEDVHPMFCFSLEPDRLTLGLGVFEFSKNTLSTYRNAVADATTGTALEKTLSAMKKQGFRVESPEYKRVPRGFDPDHPRGDLLRRKGLTVWRDAPVPRELSQPTGTDYCVEQLRAMLPVYRWLDALAHG